MAKLVKMVPRVWGIQCWPVACLYKPPPLPISPSSGGTNAEQTYKQINHRKLGPPESESLL